MELPARCRRTDSVPVSPCVQAQFCLLSVEASCLGTGTQWLRFRSRNNENNQRPGAIGIGEWPNKGRKGEGGQGRRKGLKGMEEEWILPPGGKRSFEEVGVVSACDGNKAWLLLASSQTSASLLHPNVSPPPPRPRPANDQCDHDSNAVLCESGEAGTVGGKRHLEPLAAPKPHAKPRGAGGFV